MKTKNCLTTDHTDTDTRFGKSGSPRISPKSAGRRCCVAALALCALGVRNCPAQTNTPAPTPATFVQSIQSYFSSFNTNHTGFQSNSFDLSAGMDYVSGVNATASLGLEYRVHRFTAVDLSLESVTRNSGVAGTIVSQQGGIGFSRVIMDLKLTAYLDGGYDFNRPGLYAEVGARIKKQLTQNTYAGVGIATQIFGPRPQTPILTVFTGFTF